MKVLGLFILTILMSQAAHALTPSFKPTSLSEMAEIIARLRDERHQAIKAAFDNFCLSQSAVDSFENSRSQYSDFVDVHSKELFANPDLQNTRTVIENSERELQRLDLQFKSRIGTSVYRKILASLKQNQSKFDWNLHEEHLID